MWEKRQYFAATPITTLCVTSSLASTYNCGNCGMCNERQLTHNLWSIQYHTVVLHVLVVYGTRDITSIIQAAPGFPFPALACSHTCLRNKSLHCGLYVLLITSLIMSSLTSSISNSIQAYLTQNSLWPPNPLLFTLPFCMHQAVVVPVSMIMHKVGGTWYSND